MKKMRRLIPAIAMLLVSAVMLSTASFAWFTMGTQATATGMTVKAEAASALLIVNEAKTGETLAKFAAATNNETFGAASTPKIPATHYIAEGQGAHTLAEGQTAPDTLLVTVSDTNKVTHATGAYSGTYNAVAEATDNPYETAYYIDYVAYLAAAGAAVEGKTLTATVTVPDGVLESIHNAVTIDFWVDASTKDTDDNGDAVDIGYIGSVNLKDAKATGGKNITLGQMDIPVAITEGTDAQGQATNVVNDYVKVIMRVYYDGALEETSGTTYVRNDQIPQDTVGFAVRFDVQ